MFAGDLVHLSDHRLRSSWRNRRLTCETVQVVCISSTVCSGVSSSHLTWGAKPALESRRKSLDPYTTGTTSTVPMTPSTARLPTKSTSRALRPMSSHALSHANIGRVAHPARSPMSVSKVSPAIPSSSRSIAFNSGVIFRSSVPNARRERRFKSHVLRYHYAQRPSLASLSLKLSKSKLLLAAVPV